MNKTEYRKQWIEKNRDKVNSYSRSWKKSHIQQIYNYTRNDKTYNGLSKNTIRNYSHNYLKKNYHKIEGYEIHHCCTYCEPYKFIYVSHQKHLEIHKFLRENNIKSDTNHYELIKHLLDETCIRFNID